MAAFDRVHQLARGIPEGRVTTYGRLAQAVRAQGVPFSARAAGWALRNCPEGVPWHRVVNARGELSAEIRGMCPDGLQRSLLEQERVRFDPDGRVDMERHLWDPAAPTGRPDRKDGS